MGLGWITVELQGKQPMARQSLVPGLCKPLQEGFWGEASLKEA